MQPTHSLLDVVVPPSNQRKTLVLFQSRAKPNSASPSSLVGVEPQQHRSALTSCGEEDVAGPPPRVPTPPFSVTLASSGASVQEPRQSNGFQQPNTSSAGNMASGGGGGRVLINLRAGGRTKTEGRTSTIPSTAAGHGGRRLSLLRHPPPVTADNRDDPKCWRSSPTRENEAGDSRSGGAVEEGGSSVVRKRLRRESMMSASGVVVLPVPTPPRPLRPNDDGSESSADDIVVFEPQGTCPFVNEDNCLTAAERLAALFPAEPPASAHLTSCTAQCGGPGVVAAPPHIGVSIVSHNEEGANMEQLRRVSLLNPVTLAAVSAPLKQAPVVEPPKVIGSADEGEVSSVGGVSNGGTTADTQRGGGSQSQLASRVQQRMSPTPTSLCSSATYPSVQHAAAAARIHPVTHVPLPAPPPEYLVGPSTSQPSEAPFCAPFFSQETVGKKYILRHKVGEGTYGEVYRGETKAFDSNGRRAQVALKRIKSLQGLDGFPLTSVREVMALKHLRDTLSPSTRRYFVQLRECILSDDFQSSFLVFDYVPHSLAGLCMRGPRDFPLQERDVAVIFLQILRGLHILHSSDVMHRDLKLDNVLIDSEARVMLCDFGLSVPTGSGRKVLTPSLVNLVYRPPEMLLGSLTYDKGVDVWSVGCMLAQIFLREPPFLVRDSARSGSELAQLECITMVLGRIMSFPEGVESIATRKFVSGELERQVVAPRSMQSVTAPVQQHRFSTWMKKQSPRGSREPLQPLSQPLYDVLDAMLVVDPRRRTTVDQLLRMPFFERAAIVEHDAMRELKQKLTRVANSHVLSVKQEMDQRRAALR